MEAKQRSIEGTLEYLRKLNDENKVFESIRDLLDEKEKADKQEEGKVSTTQTDKAGECGETALANVLESQLDRHQMDKHTDQSGTLSKQSDAPMPSNQSVKRKSARGTSKAQKVKTHEKLVAYLGRCRLFRATSKSFQVRSRDLDKMLTTGSTDVLISKFNEWQRSGRNFDTFNDLVTACLGEAPSEVHNSPNGEVLRPEKLNAVSGKGVLASLPTSVAAENEQLEPTADGASQQRPDPSASPVRKTSSSRSSKLQNEIPLTSENPALPTAAENTDAPCTVGTTLDQDTGRPHERAMLVEALSNCKLFSERGGEDMEVRVLNHYLRMFTNVFVCAPP